MRGSQQSGSRQQPGGRYDTHWSLVPASDHLSTESCLPQPGAGWAAWIQLSQEMVIMSWQWLVAGGWWPDCCIILIIINPPSCVQPHCPPRPPDTQTNKHHTCTKLLTDNRFLNLQLLLELWISTEEASDVKIMVNL